VSAVFALPSSPCLRCHTVVVPISILSYTIFEHKETQTRASSRRKRMRRKQCVANERVKLMSAHTQWLGLFLGPFVTDMCTQSNTLK
jgi:hypothetical protein